MNRLWKIYDLTVTILFFIYLTGIMSFWRAFSILHIKIGSLTIFITEFMLIFSLPFIVRNIKKILVLPKILLIALSFYFAMGTIYLFYALLINKNLFALRDLVLFVYVLFLPLSVFILSGKGNLRFILYCVIFSDLIAVFIVRAIIFNFFTPGSFFYSIIYSTRSFNYGLFFGMVLPIYYALIIDSRKAIYKYFLIFLLSVNLYLILIIGERSVWLSFLVLIIFLLLSSRKKVRNLLTILGLSLIITSSLFFLDFKLLKSTYHYYEVNSKVHSVGVILSDLCRKTQDLTYVGKKVYPVEIGNNSPESKMATTDGNIGFKNESRVQDSKKHSLADKLLEYFYKLRNSIKPEKIAVLDNLFWRLSVWQQGIEFGMKSSIFGRGFGVNPDYMAWGIESIPLVKSLGVDSSIVPAHNHLLTIFIKMGFLGFFLFLFINIYIFVFAFRQIDQRISSLSQYLLLGFLGAFIFWHVLALFFNVIESPPTSIFLWVITGFMFACIKLMKERSSGEA